MSSALPIVSALMPVLSERKKTGVADGPGATSAATGSAEVMPADRMRGRRLAGQDPSAGRKRPRSQDQETRARTSRCVVVDGAVMADATAGATRGSNTLGMM